jgi:hypothetical protein
MNGYGPPPLPYLNLSHLYPPGLQYGYGHVPPTLVCYFCFVDKYVFVVLVCSLMYLMSFCIELSLSIWRIGTISRSFQHVWVLSLWLELNMWVLWNKSTYVSLESCKRTCIWVLQSSLVVCCMRIGVCGCICMLYVILVNICSVDQFTLWCELSKLQINLAKSFLFL